MLNDNSAAILDYLITENYNQKYSIKILVSKVVDCSKYQNVKNVKIIRNPLSTLWNIFRSMRVFHSQGMTACAVIPCRGQIIFDLWHGSPLKAIGLIAGKNWDNKTDSYFLCASPFMGEINKKCFGLEDDQIFIGSNPRNDLMFVNSDNDYLKLLFKGKRVILFMPTFRQSKGLGVKDSTTEFPILNEGNIDDLDQFLNDKNIILIIKPHPYQDDIPLFKKECKNIKIIKNSDLNTIGISLYSLLGMSDALITDFSSVYFDYLLLNRPIGFVIEDMSEYEKQRGYTVDNPLELMPGAKIQSMEEFFEFIENVNVGNDEYSEDRKRVNSLCNTFTTPDASKRILDFLSISK